MLSKKLFLVLLTKADGFAPSPPAQSATALDAKKNSKRLEEMRSISEKDRTAEWADTIAARLDAARFAETETALLDECSGDERDMMKIDKMISQFTEGVVLAPSGDYRLVWAKTDEAVGEIGTGLHRVPLARLEDIFLSLRDDAILRTKEIRMTEIVRVIGPFPNVKNSLFGSFQGIKNKLHISYKRGVDGTGKSLEGKARDISFSIVHSTDRCLILGASSLAKDEWLVFQREDDLPGALNKLRVPLNDDSDDPASVEKDSSSRAAKITSIS